MNLSFFLTAKKKPPTMARQERPGSAEQRELVRAEVIKLSLRDTLSRAKIPVGAVDVEVLPVAGGTGAVRRMRLRLVLREWDGRLVHALVQFERAFVRRLKLLDPKCGEWLLDVSWRFAAAPAAQNEENWSETVMSPLPVQEEDAPRSPLKSLLLDPERERLYANDDAHPEFSPTQPMLR